jgi:hypothetical protein
MISNSSIEQVNTDALEIHYFFGDDSHTMDANILNKCDHEILSIIREVSNIFLIDVVVETEPIAEGGIKKWLKIASKTEKVNAPITTAFLTALILAILVTPVGKISEKLIEKIFEDTEMSDLQKEKLKSEIKILKRYQLDEQQDSLDNINYNILIKKRKSNFYELLDKYPKVVQVSFAALDSAEKTKVAEKFVQREEFGQFVLVTDELQTVVRENAIIEIIAPVLKKGKYKWIGHYNGDIIHFNMKSEEFRRLVQDGKVEFKNGSSINCSLEIKRKISGEGVELVSGYNVIRVDYYFQNSKPVETKEGKSHRQIREAQSSQLNFFQDIASK